MDEETPRSLENASSSTLKTPPSFGKVEEKDYTLVPATQIQINEVIQGYWHSVPVSYEIFSIEYIENPVVTYGFYAHARQLQKRANNPAFIARWESECRSEEEQLWRKEICVRLKDRSALNINSDYPDVKFLKLWHGTQPAIVGSILETGYANLAKTDNGFFGKGIYFTSEVEYAMRVYSQGALIANEVAIFSAYPVVYEDMSALEGKGNHANYDAHVVPVVPRTERPTEVAYNAARVGQNPVYTEYVTFQSAACRPRYLVTVRSTLFHAPAMASNLISIEEYKKGLLCKQNSQLTEAFEHFEKAAQNDFSPAYNELGWCYRKGLGIPQDFAKAIVCYQKAAVLGLASGHQELGFCYKRGEGVTKDLAQAVCEFKKALNKGYSRAAYELAWCYEKGEGISKDVTQSFLHFKIAADAGMTAAQYHLAKHYEQGEGTVKDFKKAKKYYQLASDQGHQDAKINLANLEKAEQTRHNHHGNNPYILQAAPSSPPTPTPTPTSNNTTQPKEEKEEQKENCLIM
jgi:hypothetical protein